MPKHVRPTGRRPSDILICGERPGFEEAIAGEPFVGPAGDELWDKLWRICRLTRGDCFVTNLVDTHSPEPPSAAEIRANTARLRLEVLTVRPTLILTIGYHAARAFLPQFADTNGDYFHGLAFPYTYGTLRARTATLVPVVHSAAALRQPGQYQNQFWRDLEAVRDVRAGRRALHRSAPLDPYRVGLAGFGKDGLTLGVDTEGSVRAPEAVTLSHEGRTAALVETWQHAPSGFLKAALLSARRLYIHNAVHDWQVLARLGIEISSVDCTMLMAYLLGLPQSLKVLAYRELGIEMREYSDLVDPLDRSLVHSVLEKAHAQISDLHRRREAASRDAAERHCRLIGRPATKKAAARYLAKAPLPTLNGQDVPRRALTSLTKIVGSSSEDQGTDEPADSDRASLRARWQKSVFAHLAPLPPPPTWKDVPEAVRVPYALGDAIAHRQVGQLLRPRLKEAGLQRVYALDRNVLPFLVRMEQVGMAVDAQALRDLDAVFARRFDKVCRRIDAHAGKPVNPLSGEQVSDCLFLELGIRPTRMTKSGKHYTTQDKYLKARKLEHAIVPDILEARQLNKYRGTYTQKLPHMLVEGRYHPDWKYTRTATGRLAEEIILLIPKHSARAKEIRNAFHATDGHTLVSIDLSQIELRAMAHLSGDRVLLRAFARGDDIHANVAHTLLGAPKGREHQDESLHRLPAKTLNFGIINGMTEYGLLDQLHEAGQLQWDIDQVRELLVGWFRLHEGVDAYWEQQKIKARKHGFVTDLFGRRRYLYAIHSTNEQIRREAERQCLCPIQATADGISKIWNRRILTQVLQPRWSEGRRYCEPWTRQHDDTTLEVDSRIARTVQAEMLQLVPQLLKVPTLAEGKRGERWGSLAA